MNIIRWGILSTALINRRVILPIRASKRGKLVAVASRSMETANVYATKWNIPIAFGNYDEMLSSNTIDAVYISLPNHLHAEWSIKAMQAGKHVLCEKPLALSVEDIDRMAEVGRETGRVLAEALMYRHHPQTKLVGERVRDGLLGDVMLLRGAFNFLLSDRNNIRLNPEYGGGSLWDVGIYPISIAQYIMGSPPVSVSGSQWVGNTGVDESFFGQLIYSDPNSTQKYVSQIAASIRSPLYTQVEVLGTQGRLIINRPFTRIDEDRNLLYYSMDGKLSKIRVPQKELYIGEIEDMQSAILDGTPIYLSLAESRDHIRTIVALYQSAQNQTEITL